MCFLSDLVLKINKQTNKNISNQNNTKKLNNSKGTTINSVKITDKIEQIRVKIWKELEEEEKAEIDTVLQTQKSKKFDFYFVHTIDILDDPYSRRISTPRCFLLHVIPSKSSVNA